MPDKVKSKAKTLVVLGETGSGKTTVLNAMCNYLLGVKKEDPFRYKVIHETHTDKRLG